MTREKLQELKSCEIKIIRMIGLVEVLNSKSSSNERVADEIMKNPDIFTEVKRLTLELAQKKLLEYEKKFEKL
jgi:hypothetical protein